ncbi:unnamed protein product [Auanema sp. JU1783]|nr:unnamed protein product [Auanema sp. JU1783]
MSTKRKRLSETVENSPPVGTPALKKRKGRFSNVEKLKIMEELKKAQGVYNVLRQHRGEENREITEHFIRTPSRRTEPEYYKTVKSPIDLTRIQQKLKTEEYHSFDQFCKDVELLVENTQAYYKEDSVEYQDALKLMNIYKDAKEKVENGIPLLTDERDTDDLESNAGSSLEARSISSRGGAGTSREVTASPETLEAIVIDDIICGMLECTDGAGKPISMPFRVLQDKETFPNYYDKIKSPIDLKAIANKARSGEYKVLGDLENDVRLLCKNAQQFYGKGSEIYKDAAILLEYFKEKSSQVLEKGVHVKRREKVVRVVDSLLTESAPVIIDNTLEDAEEDESSEESSDPKWQLYWHLRNEPDLTEEGVCLCDPFLELPSKKDYPDYYDDIKNPMSFFMINKKLKCGDYKTLFDLFKDFVQVFENACEYNIEESEYYTSARKLEEMAVNKMRELEPGVDLSMFEKKVVKRGRPPRAPKVKADVESSDEESKNTPAIKRKPRSPKKNSETPASKPGRKSIDELILRYKTHLLSLWSVVYDFKDPNEYWPAGAFNHLPSKRTYADYYDVIKNPVDLSMIKDRIENNKYVTTAHFMSEMKTMFENARSYNEPGSEVFNDSQRLEQMLHAYYVKIKEPVIENPLHRAKGRTPKSEKRMDDFMKLDDGRRTSGHHSDFAYDDNVPKVQVELRSLFLGIFNKVFTAKDVDGRTLSESFADLPDLLKCKGVPSDEWPFSFDQLRRNIEKCRYRRLDRLQKDFFDLFEKTREHSRLGSQLFEDAIELQLMFVRERDALCKNSLISNAFAVIESHVVEEIEKLRKKRVQAGETIEKDRRESVDEIANQEGEIDLPSITINDVEYSAPCYAYISRTEENSKGLPHIMRIERIFSNESGEQMLRGVWVYRPSETIHLSNRRFYENEVFITPFQDMATADRLVGKCMVVFFKTYLSHSIGGYDEKDVYVCESKYFGKPRYFQKLKSWAYENDAELSSFTARETPIEPPARICSQFVKSEPEDNQSNISTSSTDNEDRLKDFVFLDIDRPEVPVRNGEADADGRLHLIQMRSKSGKHYACGDFVLVFNPNKPYCDVMRIDKMWRDKDGSEWFSGGWLARPQDIKHESNRMFYPREVFAVNQPDQTRRVEDIQNSCAVLVTKDFVKERPTEIPECDVYVCESKVNGAPLPKGEASCLFTSNPFATSNDEEEKVSPGEPFHIDFISAIRRFKVYKNGSRVVDAEVYRFKTPITMEKEISPLLKNDIGGDALDIDMIDDTESDGAESSTSNTKTEAPTWLATQPKLTTKSKSGYILFSAEVRKRIMHENPEAGFGEVSKIVGVEWKKLSEDQKKQYEVRAEFIANERTKQEAAKALVKEQLQPGQIRVYHCKWLHCDFQFDQENALYEHVIQHHTSQIIVDGENQYVCLWYTCARNRKEGKPFPSLPRLHRHMKEKHMAQSYKIMNISQLGRNFYKLVQIPSSSGDTYQLVHTPHGRTLPPANHISGQPPMVNGHTPGHAGPEHQYQSVHSTSHPPTHSQTVYVAQGPTPHFPQQHGPPQQMQSAQIIPNITDPGRTVVKMVSNPEPVFVHAPASFTSRRVLHSETYLRYIESLGAQRQKTVSQFDRSLCSNHRNTSNKKPLPVHWLRQKNGTGIVSEEEVVKALWKMREQILESAVGIVPNRVA